ncbi:MAG: hypothetical protein AAF267_00085 [Deinococcota bacterium]
MNTVNAAGLILIVFAGFELMRWLDRLRKDISTDESSPAEATQDVTQTRVTQTLTPAHVYATQDAVMSKSMIDTVWDD